MVTGPDARTSRKQAQAVLAMKARAASQVKKGVVMRWRVLIAVIAVKLDQGSVEIALNANARRSGAIGHNVDFSCRADEKTWQLDT